MPPRQIIDRPAGGLTAPGAGQIERPFRRRLPGGYTASVEILKREAARGVVVTPQGELLLMRLRLPRLELWITPGGGIDSGETPEAALRRELLEETALDTDVIGPHLWSRTVRIAVGTVVFEQRETFYLIQARRYEPRFMGMPGDKERDWLREFRWWKAGEIIDSSEIFAPRQLGELLADLLHHGVPATPLELVS
jgi:8-oxo-dGTP diphosphatase